MLSKAFRVQRFGVKDATMFPIDVQFTREERADEDEGAEEAAAAAGGEPVLVRKVKTLFPRFYGFPDKKIFSRRVRDDFSVDVNYGDLTYLPEDQRALVGSLNLSSVDLSAVADAFKGHENDTEKGVKIHFRIDESGVLQIDKAEAVFERPPPPAEDETKPKEDDKGYMEKLSEFFTGDDKDETKKKAADGDDEKQADEPKAADGDEPKAADAEEDNKDQAADADKDQAADADKDKTAEKDDEKAGDAKKKDEKPGEDKAADSKKKDTPPPPPPPPKKPLTLREQVKIDVQVRDVPRLSDELFQSGISRLAELRRQERERKDNEMAKNTLEAFIYTMQDKLETEDVQKCSTSEERETLATGLSEASLWLEDDGFDSTAAEYNSRVRALNKTAAAINFRVSEMHARPEAFKNFQEMMSMCAMVIVQARNYTFNLTQADMDTYNRTLNDFVSFCNETSAWFAEKSRLQNETALTEDPVITVADVDAKTAKFVREMKYLYGLKERLTAKAKARDAKRKAREEAKAKKAANATATDGNTTATPDDAADDAADDDAADQESEQRDQGQDEQTGGQQDEQAGDDGPDGGSDSQPADDDQEPEAPQDDKEPEEENDDGPKAGHDADEL